MNSKRGDAGVVALIAGLTAAIVGIFLNVKISASEPTCLYHAEAQVVRQDTSILPISENGEENYGVSNANQLAADPKVPAGPFGRFDDNGNQINEYYENLSMFTFHHDNLALAEEEKNKTISVNLLGLNSNKWKIVGQFCESLRRDKVGCPDNLDQNNTDVKIDGFKKSCEVHIKYGWVVAPKNNYTEKCYFDTDSCKPKNPQISFSGNNRVRVEWENPASCLNLTQLKDKIQIDIKNTSNDIICSKNVDVSNNDTGTDCKLGRDIIRNTQRPEELQNGEYTTLVRVANESGSCISPDATNKANYIVVPPPTDIPPTNTPIPEKCERVGQYCSDDYTEDCTTEDSKPGKKQCHKEGRCNDIGDLTKCGWDDQRSSCGACIPNEGENDPPPDPTGLCQTIIGTGKNRVLLIPYNFPSSDEFATYTTGVIDNLRKTNLGDLYNEFTFVAYNKFFPVWNGQYGCNNDTNFSQDKVVKCDDVEAIRKTFADCNINSAGLVIAKLEGKYSFAAAAQVASIGYKYTVSAPHELGHAIARLGDEYSFKQSTTEQSGKPNCSSASSCPWSGECIAVCGYTNWKRPSQKSPMNLNANWSREFNNPSLNAWRLALNGGGGRLMNALQRATSNNNYNQSLYLKLRQNQRGELSLENMQIKNAYPIDLEAGLTKDYFSIKMIDSEANVLHSGQFSSKNTVYSEPNPPRQVLREMIELHLPCFDNLASVEIYNPDGQKKLDIDLDEFDLPTPTPRENLCGNGVCDSTLGENQNSCAVDCRPQNDYRNNYKELSSDINQDNRVNILDCSICLQQYKKKSSGLSCDIINDSKIDVLDYTTCLNNLGKIVEHAPEESLDDDPTL